MIPGRQRSPPFLAVKGTLNHDEETEPPWKIKKAGTYYFHPLIRKENDLNQTSKNDVQCGIFRGVPSLKLTACT